MEDHPAGQSSDPEVRRGDLPALRPSLDFSSYITDRTRHFVGREWVFRRIADWLECDESRYFLLTGEPGSGKTAIAARLAVISATKEPDPEGMAGLRPGFLSAMHFCSARDRYWSDPFTFAGSLATQLANRYPAVLKNLTEQDRGRAINVEVTQQVGAVTGGQVAGVVINVSGPSPEAALIRAVREPLEALFAAGHDESVVMLVDALDEALAPAGMGNIVPLLADAEYLPAGVRFILTSRRDDRVENQFRSAETVYLSAPQHDEQNRRDIAVLVTQQLPRGLGARGTTDEPGAAGRDQVIQAITEQAGGNFQYVTFLLRSIANGTRRVGDLQGIPEGLDGLYYDSLTRVVNLGGKEWIRDYAPLLGFLSVAQSDLAFGQLQRFCERTESVVWSSLRDLTQFVEETGPAATEDEPRLRLFHQSFADFLDRRFLRVGDKTFPNTFYLPPTEWHERIVNYYRTNFDDWALVDWERADEYGLRHIVAHLYQLRSVDTHRRALCTIVSPSLRAAKRRRLFSDESFIADVELVIEALQEEGLAGVPMVLALSAGQAAAREEGRNMPLPLLLVLFAVGRREEAIAGLRMLARAPGRQSDSADGTDPGPGVEEVRGLGQMAEICRRRGDTGQALALLERAADAAAKIYDQDTRWPAIQEAIEATSAVDDASWVAKAIRHLVPAIRSFSEPLRQGQGLLICARRLRRANLDERARDLIEEASRALADLAPSAIAAIDLANVWRELGEPVRAGQVLNAAAERIHTAEMPTESLRHIDFAVLLASGQTAEATTLAQNMRNPDPLVFSAHYLHSIAELDSAWDIAEQVFGAEMLPGMKAAIVRRESELGDPDSALRRLRQLEQAWSHDSIELSDRMEVRLSAAEASLAEDPGRAKDLLTEALALHRDWTRALAQYELPGLSGTEGTLLHLASDLAAVQDRPWSEAALEEALAIMLSHSTREGFSMPADVWPVQARARVAGAMARIGAIDRADALLAEALDAIARIQSPRSRRAAIAALAECAAEAPDPSWTSQVAEKLLKIPAIKPDTTDIDMWTALARQALELPTGDQVVRGALREVAGIAHDMVSIVNVREYRDSFELHQHLDVIIESVSNGLAALAGSVADPQEASDIVDLAWQLARSAMDVSIRRALLENAIRTTEHLTGDRVVSLINDLELPAERGTAWVLLGALRAEQGHVDQAQPMLDVAFDEVADMALTGENPAVLDQIVSTLPVEAETVGGWLVKMLLKLRDQDWHVWLVERLIASARHDLTQGDSLYAQGTMEFAVATAERAWDPVHTPRAWAEVAGAYVQAGNAQDAADAYRRALTSIASAAASAQESLTEFVRVLDSVESVFLVASLVWRPEYDEIRAAVALGLARRYATFGAVQLAQDLVARLTPAQQDAAEVQIAVGLAEAGRLQEAEAAAKNLRSAADQKRAIVGIASCAADLGAADALSFTRFGDIAEWVDALAEVAAGWFDNADVDDDDVPPAIQAQLARRLDGADLAAALARIAGMLARRGRQSARNREPDNGGELEAAVPFLRAALSEAVVLEREQKAAASLRCLVAVASAGTADEPGPAMRLLRDWAGQSSRRARVLASVAGRALDGQHGEVVNGACRQLLAEEAWLWAIFTLAYAAGQGDWFAYSIPAADLYAHSSALARVMPKVADEDRAVARQWAARPMFLDGRALVQATLAAALRTHGDETGADEVLADALDAALAASPAGWATSSIALAGALAEAGRVTEALRLAEEISDQRTRNDIIDEIARAVVDAGSIEDGLALLGQLSDADDDPLVVYRDDLRVHTAAAAAAEACVERQSFEQAIAIINELDDRWAARPRRAALASLGEHAAGHSAAEARRIADIVFAAAKEARRRNRDESLHCVTAFTPLLGRMGADAVMATWTQLQHIRDWSSSL